jgi:hypothetical protein
VDLGGFMGFLLSEKYRLEIHWDSVEKDKDYGVLYFRGAYFSGPALNAADKINGKDEIKLDFCSQYTILVKNVYIATFAWEGVTYKDKKIYLNKAVLSYDRDVEGIPTLKNNDYIVIDTRNHENEKHYYNMFYPAFAVNKENEMYNFRS